MVTRGSPSSSERKPLSDELCKNTWAATSVGMQRKQRATEAAVIVKATRRSTRWIVSGEGSEEVPGEGLLELGHRRGNVVEKFVDGGHGAIQAARVDEVEQGEVGG